jgi:hypothetical protein
MALVPTHSLRQFRGYDGQVTLQQMFLEGGVTPLWKDVPIVDYHDESEVRRRNAEHARNNQISDVKKGGAIVP